MGKPVLIVQVGAEERRIVGVERYEKSGVKVLSERVRGKGRTNSGAHIGRRIQFQRRASLFQILQQVKVSNRGERVPDTFRADRERLPDGLWAGGFAGVVGEPQPSLPRLRKERAE